MTSRQGSYRFVAFACVAGAAALAHADSPFSFVYADPHITGTCWLMASTPDPLSGMANVTQGIFVVPNGPLAGTYNLLPNASAPAAVISPMGRFIYNDVLYTGPGASLDVYGLLFTAPGREINIWGNGSQPYSLWSSAGSGYDYSSDQGTFVPQTTSAAVPAPGVSALAAVGMLFVVRRRRFAPRH